jgi:hypothetical protein
MPDELPCVRAIYEDQSIDLLYTDGKHVRFPVSANRRLRGQPEKKLRRIEVSPLGIHWPELDEDLSHAGLRAGRFDVS